MIERFELGGGYSISRIIKGGWQLSKGHSGDVSHDPVGDMSDFVRRGIDTDVCYSPGTLWHEGTGGGNPWTKTHRSGDTLSFLPRGPPWRG